MKPHEQPDHYRFGGELFSPEEAVSIKAAFGDDARVVMGFWAAKQQFGWLALRLLYDIHDRLGLVHNGSQIPFSIASHLPFKEYVKDQVVGALVGYVAWENRERNRKRK